MIRRAYSFKAMALFLIRHAQAGQRVFGPHDRDRPLSPEGEVQARGLITALNNETITRLLSSPFPRCQQTLAPLAAWTGLAVETTPKLAEGMPFEPVLDMMAELPEGAVLCSHGDVIPDVVQALVRRGLAVVGEPRWSKGSVWVLERDGEDWTEARSFRL